MKAQMRRMFAIALLGMAAAWPAQAADWGQVATISSTLGINANRLCVGEGTRSDIGCPTYAPTISSGGLLTATALSATSINGQYASFTTLNLGEGLVEGTLTVYGNLNVSGSQTIDGVTFANGGVSATGIVTATSFSGDGSRLTSLPSGDRITSGTSSIIVSNSGHISFTTAGTERMVINSSGNVGIGTASPLSPFDITQTGNSFTSGLTLQRTGTTRGNLYLDASTDTLNLSRAGVVGLSVKSTGNVGIGTTAPSQTLTIIGTDAAPAESGYAPNGALRISAPGTNRGLDMGTYAGGFSWIQSRNVAAYGANYTLAINPNGGNVGIGTVTPTSALQVSGTFTVSSTVTNANPALYVSTSGNVGIGTASPRNELHVHDGANTRVDLTLTHSGTGSSVSDGLNILMSSNDAYVVNRESGPLYLGAGGTLTHMTLTAGGNVGIGTTAPSQTLHVAGSALTTSWTYINANTAVRVTPTTPLEVSGTISATAFVGDGSGLTGVTTTSDRITSGTSSVIVSQSGHISFTTAGTERMVINSSGNVGIGTSLPSTTLHLDGGNLRLGGSSSTGRNIEFSTVNSVQSGLYWLGGPSGNSTSGGYIEFNKTANWGGDLYIKAKRSSGGDADIGGLNMRVWDDPTGYPSQNTHVTINGITSRTINTSAVFSVMEGSGATNTRPSAYFARNVGVGTASPTSALQVSGTFTVSSTITNANPALYVSSSGNVGIGTATPNSTLEVNGGVRFGGTAANGITDYRSTGGSLRGSIWTDGTDFTVASAGVAAGLILRTNSTNRVRIDSDGNVGIGTTLPSQTLHVSGTLLTTSWTYINANTAVRVTPTTPLEVSGTISATDLRLSGNLYVSGSQTIDGVTFANGGVSATGIVTATSFSGDGSRLTSLPSGDRITSGTSSIIVSQSGHISFTTAGTERMVINSAGNVGIGTTAPAQRLQIGSGAFGANALMQFYTGNGLGVERSWQVGVQGGSASTAGENYDFVIRDSDVTKMLIAWNTGNVGIGTVTPTSALQVSGTFTVSSTVTNANPALYVSTTGNVGIGTQTPRSALEVAGAIPDVTVRSLYAVNALLNQTVGRISFFPSTSNLYYASIAGTTGNFSSQMNLSFFTHDNVIGNGERMRITNTGNVGIGTTAPSATTHVSGTLMVKGGTGAETCDTGYTGMIRLNPTTGRLQLCR